MERNTITRCERCGAPYSESSDFCQNCGAMKTADKDAGAAGFTAGPHVPGGAPYIHQKAYGNSARPSGGMTGAKIGFPAASVCFILMALLSIAWFIVGAVLGSINFWFLLYNFATLIAYVFIVVVLLAKKRGALLTAAISALAVLPLIWLVIVQALLLGWLSFQMTIPLLPYHYFLMLLFAVICNKKQESTENGPILKLWFVPGIVRTVLFAMNVASIMQMGHSYSLAFVQSSLSMTLLNIINRLNNIVSVVAAFLLGYWIFRIYSVSHPVNYPAARVPAFGGGTHNAGGFNVAPPPVYKPAAAPPPPGYRPAVSQQQFGNRPLSAQLPLEQRATTAAPPPGYKFCGACGSRISSANAFCPVCGSRLAEQMP